MWSVLEHYNVSSKTLNEVTTLIATEQVDESSWILETKRSEI
jgi:hypothetical protein